MHQSLPKVQETAGKWAQSITALLGVFSVVAFLKGPQSLADLRVHWAITVICMIGAAGLAAAAAIYAAALAAQGSPRWVEQLDGWQLKVLHKSLGRHAARLLGLSRVLAVAAALILLAAIIVASLAQTLDPKPKPKPIVPTTTSVGSMPPWKTFGVAYPTNRTMSSRGRPRHENWSR